MHHMSITWTRYLISYVSASKLDLTLSYILCEVRASITLTRYLISYVSASKLGLTIYCLGSQS